MKLMIISSFYATEDTNAWFVSFIKDSSIIPAPEEVTLTNYPNPFNPSTIISYSLPYEGQVSLDIYNVKGQLVKQLAAGSQLEGYYEVTWNGKDSSGRSVASGEYFVLLKFNNKNRSAHKIMLLK
jgi:FlgD Ig-like domain